MIKMDKPEDKKNRNIRGPACSHKRTKHTLLALPSSFRRTEYYSSSHVSLSTLFSADPTVGHEIYKGQQVERLPSWYFGPCQPVHDTSVILVTRAIRGLSTSCYATPRKTETHHSTFQRCQKIVSIRWWLDQRAPTLVFQIRASDIPAGGTVGQVHELGECPIWSWRSRSLF
jgi:hypothetical protein